MLKCVFSFSKKKPNLGEWAVGDMLCIFIFIEKYCLVKKKIYKSEKAAYPDPTTELISGPYWGSEKTHFSKSKNNRDAFYFYYFIWVYNIFNVRINVHIIC